METLSADTPKPAQSHTSSAAVVRTAGLLRGAQPRCTFGMPYKPPICLGCKLTQGHPCKAGASKDTSASCLLCLPASVLAYSRSYAEDVTSVTSGASQGPHSFNLVFVCLFVCVTPGAIPYLSRTVPYHQTQLATYSWPQYSNRAFKRKIIT